MSIPVDVIDEIFVRLPLKSLVRCKCLSKAWASRIPSSSFINKQILQYAKHQHIVFFHGDPDIRFYTLHVARDLWPLAPVEGYAPMRRVHLPTQFPYHIIGSCNGVICLGTALGHGIILWNPTIRRMLTVPHFGHGILGFGFDKLTNDYKVVRLCYSSTGPGEAHVYSLSTNTWRKSPSPFPSYRCGIKGYFFDRSLYWIAKRVVAERNDHRLILSFDIGNEVFSDIELPEPSWHTKQLLSIKGSLCVFSAKYGSGFGDHSIWKRDGSGAWSLIYQLNDILLDDRLTKVLPVSMNDDYLLAFRRGGFYVCDLATHVQPPRFVEFSLLRGDDVKDIETYVESTVLLDKKGEREWMAKSIQKMLKDGIETWAPKLPVKKATVDFSSPNIAKEMHVGHLRSTIIGDTLARMLEFSKVKVLRKNHVGDWGTQFGMLIEFLFEKFPDGKVSDQAIGDLETFYKASKQRFDGDPEFKERAQQAVVSLQGGDEKYRKAWGQICEISRKSYGKVYERLGVHFDEKGESFYNLYIPETLDLLREKGLIKESEGAQVIFIEGKEIPLTLVKRDGGFNYASTDLAALWFHVNMENAKWIIYVTDVGQREHFEMYFTAAKSAGWLPTDESKYPKTSHVGFDLVLGDDGKRFSEVVKLVDLLDEAKTRCKAALVERGKAAEWTAEELEHTAEALGYGAVKYANLKNNRLTNYTFNFDQMLNEKGNTAVYLLYAHAEICSIIRKSGKDIEELKKTGQLILEKEEERKLGLHLLQFAEVVEDSCTTLLPNTLCEYLYDLSEKFTSFYSGCQVVGSAEETSRLLLCEATALVMRQCFHLLGINPVYKI